MALEQRGAQTYYYRKTRSGARVISEYLGSGDLAFLAFQYDRQAREEIESQRLQAEKERANQRATDEMVKAFCNEADALEDALFLLHGYHVHSRQWRRSK